VAVLLAFGLGLVADHIPSIFSSDSTFTIHGSVTLLPGAYVPDGNGGCTTSGGYSDISAGTAVTIGDQTGTTIAVGQLQAGRAAGDGEQGCTFDFDVQTTGIHTLYTVTVSHRGTQTFTSVQADQGIALTLGG
jgi:hypothetical protein